MPLNFNTLIERFGEIAAWSLLAEIERASNLKPQHGNSDAEARLAVALSLQDVVAGAKTLPLTVSHFMAA